MSESLAFWIGFIAFVAVMLGLDLGIFHRRERVMSFKESVAWSVFWVSLAAGFAVLIYLYQGHQRALEFVTGYLVEESLSIDNLFVFIVIFSFFQVKREHQHKVLFWGIVGALVMRGLFIFAGITLIRRLEWVIYLFGAFLIFTGIKLAMGIEDQVKPAGNPVIKLARRCFRVSEHFQGSRFFKKEAGQLYVTPLFLVLLVVETTDIFFAADSIPAVLAITRNPFIVFTSNVFAILGLRALYFMLAGMMEMFHYLSYGISAILIFVGCKMLAARWMEIPTGVALGAVAGILFLAIVASLLKPGRQSVSQT